MNRPKIAGFPIALSIEPTTTCNLRCPHCPSGLKSFSRPTGKIEEILFYQTIDELGPYLMYLNFYFQGEPFLHPSFLKMVKYASSKKIFIATSTNGHYLSDKNAKEIIASGLDKLIISIDGTTQEVFEQYRIGGNLQKVISGIKTLTSYKKLAKSKKPFIVLQFIIFRHNEHQVHQMKLLAKELKADKVSFKSAQIYDYNNSSSYIPSNNKFSRYHIKNGRYHIENEHLQSCWRMWHSSVITWDGKVIPCCFDKDAKHNLGNISQTNFFKIWNSNNYFNFRKSILTSRKNIDICQNCTEGINVWKLP